MATARFRRRIWSEMVPFDTLRLPRVRGLLERFGVGLIAAVRPWQLDSIGPLVRSYRDAGLEISLWPMLADEHGRWANASNLDRFAPFVREVLDRVGEPVPAIAIDLEPDVQGPIRYIAGRTPGDRAAPAQLPAGVDPRVRVRALVDELHARGASVFSAFVPLVLFERGDDGAWETLLGTPVRDLPFDDLNAMLYTSMLQGWSRGLLRRNDARALLHASCVAAHRAFGTRASASLGLVDVGVFGNEPTYRDVRILADDVAIARGAGIDDLALYDLGGVLGRPPAERWLEAFVHTPGLPAPPRRTLRAGIAVRSAGPLGSMIRMTAQAIGRLRSR